MREIRKALAMLFAMGALRIWPDHDQESLAVFQRLFDKMGEG